MIELKFDCPLGESFHPGSFSFVTVAPENLLRERLGRERLAGDWRIGLKVFKDQFAPLEEFKWKHAKFYDATRIQNLFWMEGIAPRIFDLALLEIAGVKHWGQVTEIIEDNLRGMRSQELGEKTAKVMSKYHIGSFSVDPNPHHQYMNYAVDFSHSYFVREGKEYEEELVKRMDTEAGWGSRTDSYQSIKELGISGQRNLEQRLSAYRWDEVDFKGKTVLDYGCSSGEMCREAVRRGAKRVVGLELPAAARIAYETSNWLGYFNIDYLPGNFRHEKGNDVYKTIVERTGIEKFDIVLYLSCQQLLWPDYFRKVVGEKLFLEGHSGDHQETFEEKLKEDFNKVEFIGASNDHGVRPVFICSEPK